MIYCRQDMLMETATSSISLDEWVSHTQKLYMQRMSGKYWYSHAEICCKELVVIRSRKVLLLIFVYDNGLAAEPESLLNTSAQKVDTIAGFKRYQKHIVAQWTINICQLHYVSDTIWNQQSYE